MSIHKLTAGSGYDYLTRQVAAQDATEKGAASLASYYAEKGESPGRWVGSGLAGLDGLAEGDVVTAEQMKALFGSGRHPLSEEMRARLEGPTLRRRTSTSSRVWGCRTRCLPTTSVPSGSKSPSGLQSSIGGRGCPLPRPGRSRTVPACAAKSLSEFFHAEFGRAPRDAREIAATIAKHSRPRDHRGGGL
jgi:hypothetical protein